MKVRFGMLVTDAYGKAGGQYIRRRGGIRVLSNISIPTQRNASLQNPQRIIMSMLFSSWTNLVDTEKENYVEIASIIRGVNGWGDEKLYSGREVYIKLNSLYYPYAGTLIDSSTFDQTIPVTTVTAIEVDYDLGTIVNDVASFPNAEFYQFKAMRISSLSDNAQISKMKTFAREETPSNYYNLFTQFIQTFPSARGGQAYAFAIRGISLYGISSDWVFMKNYLKP